MLENIFLNELDIYKKMVSVGKRSVFRSLVGREKASKDALLWAHRVGGGSAWLSHATLVPEAM